MSELFVRVVLVVMLLPLLQITIIAQLFKPFYGGYVRFFCNYSNLVISITQEFAFVTNCVAGGESYKSITHKKSRAAPVLHAPRVVGRNSP